MKVFYGKVTDLEKDVQALFDLLKWEELIKEGERVLIKPNFCANYGDGVTTNMELLGVIINLVRRRTGDVFVGETDSPFKDHKKMRDNFPLDCEFLNLSEEETFIHKGLNLPKIALESVIINVPVFKTHMLTEMTLGIKNLFGLIQDRKKSKYHYRIDSTLLDILDVIKPSINILDGIYSMDQTGPTDGRIRRTDFLMASRDVIALDMAACGIAGVDPLKIGHIRRASQKYGTQTEFCTDFCMDFDVPKVSKVVKCGAYLQQNPLTKKFLEDPDIYSFTKRVKNAIVGPKR
ncbi:MAG: DUF362 domain-containing protein [Candidatus Hydrothermarchaeaceae archaeon]